MKLTTSYLGFQLPHPVILGASPLADDLDTVRRFEDAGAPMIVLHSLFEEEIVGEEMAHGSWAAADESYSESLSYLPDAPGYSPAPERYIEHLGQVKRAVSVPVIGSLNGTTPGGWLRYATQIQQAGADALELNLYDMVTDPNESSEAVENRAADVVREIRKAVTIPVAVKLSPFYSALAHFAQRLDGLGIDGLLVFNRFYQPDLDPEAGELTRTILSSPADLPLRLRWVGVLFGQIRADLAVTGGVHTVPDVVKAVMCGAAGVQMVSALLKYGPEYLTRIVNGLSRWLDEHEYESLQQLRGSQSLLRCTDPTAYERANYARALRSWTGG